MSLDRKDTYCPLPRRRWEKERERKHPASPPKIAHFVRFFLVFLCFLFLSIYTGKHNIKIKHYVFSRLNSVFGHD